MPCFLIVEDNPLMRKMLSQVLETRFPRANILEAVDGKQALEMAEHGAPDIILLDIELPDANGLDLIRRIKARNPAVRILVVTLYDGPEYEAVASKNGADRLLSKRTHSSDDIAQAVQVLLQTASS